LHKVDRAYRLTPDTAMFLDRNSPAYLGGTLGFLLTPQLKECFHELTNAVRQGGTAVSDEGTVSDDNQIWVEFANVMGPLMHLPSMKLVELIGGDPQRPLRVLDVAAGHGLFGITVAKHFPNATVTALDWPNVLNVAAENAAKAGVLNRFQRLSGNAFDVEWGGPFDVVLLTNILHHFDVDRCEHLVRRAFASLAPQGRAITLEFIPNEDRISPASTATFALTMLATTARGDAYTFAEYDHMFQKAGFVRSEFHSIIPTPQQAIVSYKS
ncbi:MAG: class I SAM-dependent methyltransferase, partial [Planctomycetes bacterium]|nr:class I SAM-dependent methyltransferase [Planctomycetota bacterium]